MSDQTSTDNEAPRPKARIRWFVYGGGFGEPLVKMPRTATMRGRWAGYDAECSCG